MATRKLYAPHLNKVKVSLDQGMDQIDWTCQVEPPPWRNHLPPCMFQEWEEFTNSCLAEVDIYKDLINRANDIYYSRVEKLLDSIANVEVNPKMQFSHNLTLSNPAV